MYSVASPPLTLPIYQFSHYVMCIAGCVVRRHLEATLSTWLPMPVLNDHLRLILCPEYGKWLSNMTLKSLISSHYLSLTSVLTVPLGDSRRLGFAKPRPVGRGNWTLDHIHTFWPHKDMEGLSGGWGISSMPGHLRDNTNMKDEHTIHTSIHSNKANMKGWLWRPNDIRGTYGPKASWHLSYRWGNPRKNIIQKTCPDRGSNPGPLHTTACSIGMDMRKSKIIYYNRKKIAFFKDLLEIWPVCNLLYSLGYTYYEYDTRGWKIKSTGTPHILSRVYCPIS